MMTDAPRCPRPREGLGKKNQCAYSRQEGYWKNECPQWVRDSQKVPQTRGRDQVIKGKYQPTLRGAHPWEENNVGIAGLEGYEKD
jgi:hypothetical protein